MNLLSRIPTTARTIARRAAVTFLQVFVPLLLVAGIAGVTSAVAISAAIAGLAAAVTVVLNSVHALRVTDTRGRVIKTAAEAGLGVLAAAGLGVINPSTLDAALTAAVLAGVTALVAAGQSRIENA